MQFPRTLPSLALPLLSKELAEQSSRPRTYVVRTLFAAAFYGIALWSFYRQMGGAWSRGDLSMLGTGVVLFHQVFWTQLAAIYLVLPALMAGVVTSEKERDTLGLLLITKLRPRTIVLEKFLSRVIPMLLYLSLSLPLWGVAYSLGGFAVDQIVLASTLLIVAVLQVGTLGVLASVYYRTTAQALLATYVSCPLSAISVLCVGTENLIQHGLRTPTSSPAMTVGAVVCLLAALGAFPTFLGLAMATNLLWERAFLQPQNLLLKWLQELDKFFHELNDNSLTRGIVLINDELKLPLFAPIAWRETQKRSMGTFRYLTRLLLVVEVPLLFFIVLPLSDNLAWDRGFRVLDLGNIAVWWVAIFAILASATGLISGERSRQTLDVLLSTPMSARQIVREKFAGVQRLICVLIIPLATVLGFRIWWLAQMSYAVRDFDWIVDLLQSIGSALVYLPLIGWIGVHCSLRFRSQIAGMTTALGIVVGISIVPQTASAFGFFSFVNNSYLEPKSPVTVEAALTILFPATGPRFSAEAAPLSYGLVVTHFLLYALAWTWLRRRAAQELVRLTGRCETGRQRMQAQPRFERDARPAEA